MKNRPLLFLFLKTFVYPLKLMFFKNKTYFEDRFVQKKKLKKGTLIVSNHASVMDYVNYFFLFFWDKVSVVAAEFNFERKILKKYLKAVSAIKADRNNRDISFVEESADYLRKGKKVLIFPEGRTNDTKDVILNPISPTYILIALKSGAPIVPVYTDGNFHFFKRNHTIIGKPIDICSLLNKDNPDKEEILRLSKIVENKLIELGNELKIRQKSKVFEWKHFWLDFGKWSFILHMWIIMRPKIRCIDKKSDYKRDGHYIMAFNHIGQLDSAYVMVAFWRRRLFYLAAKEIFGLPKHKIRAKLLKDIGCIPLDRSKLDVDAIENTCQILNQGKVAVIFPEGGVQVSGKVNTLKLGTAMIAARTNSPILPIYRIKNTHWWQRKTFYVGKPIYVNEGNDMPHIMKYNEQLETSLKELEIYANTRSKKHGKK